MPLNTCCSHCGRLFPVYAQQIRERRGKVDCPQCGKRFDAIGGLLDEVTADASPQPATSMPAQLLDLKEGQERAGRAPAALWLAGVLILVALSILQIGWWDRGKWILGPRTLSAAVAVCGPAGCGPLLPRLAGSIEIRQPLLSERREAPGGPHLTLAMTLVSKADVSQRLPQLQLELYDEDGGLMAARRFGPEKYLKDADRSRGLAPGGTVRPTLDLEPLPTPPSGFRIRLF